MRYIQNVELREWVKDNLRKTIFQKAHALAIQTGCDILVKLHDNADTTTSYQYYGTGNLQKAYNNNALRKHPGEKFVSGETGLPLVDQAIQSECAAFTLPTNEDLPQESFSTDDSQHISGDNNIFEHPTLPLHLTVANEPSSAPEDDLAEQEEPVGKESNVDELFTDVQIKIEKMEPEPEETTVLSETGESSGAVPEAFGDFQENISMNTDDSGLAVAREEQSTSRYLTPMSAKPYQCAMCQKAFRSVQVLQKHTQTFHMRGQGSLMSSRGRGRGHMFTSSVKRFQCVMCNRSFTHPDLLQDHMTRSHMSSQAAQHASDQSALSFPNASNAPSTATSAFNIDNSSGPFQLTDTIALAQSQPSTSATMMQSGQTFSSNLQMSSPSPNQQKRKHGGASAYRTFPGQGSSGRVGLGASPVGLKAQGSSTKTLQANEEGSDGHQGYSPTDDQQDYKDSKCVHAERDSSNFADHSVCSDHGNGNTMQIINLLTTIQQDQRKILAEVRETEHKVQQVGTNLRSMDNYIRSKSSIKEDVVRGKFLQSDGIQAVIGDETHSLGISETKYLAIRDQSQTAKDLVLKLIDPQLGFFSKEELSASNVNGGEVSIGSGANKRKLQKSPLIQDSRFLAMLAQARKEYPGQAVGLNLRVVFEAINNKCRKQVYEKKQCIKK